MLKYGFKQKINWFKPWNTSHSAFLLYVVSKIFKKKLTSVVIIVFTIQIIYLKGNLGI